MKNYKISYTKKIGSIGEMIVKGKNEKEAIQHAKNTCFTGTDFFVSGETCEQTTNKGNTRGRNRAN
ncbi:MAG: hypothetical protein ACHQ1D_00105 [Nitrososphaerales archaeon]